MHLVVYTGPVTASKRGVRSPDSSTHPQSCAAYVLLSRMPLEQSASIRAAAAVLLPVTDASDGRD
jgi:hypothetical protein